MPSYSYHLKLELYPTSDPTAWGSKVDRHRDLISLLRGNSGIFDDLPAHPREPVPRPRLRKQGPSYPNGTVDLPLRGSQGPSGEASSQSPTDIIDCGPTRSTDEPGQDEVGSHGRTPGRKRAGSVPPPGFNAGIGPRTAAKDWRFGKVCIESFDLVDEKRQPSSARSYSEGSMAGESSSSSAVPAASLGPNLGGVGQATKARYIELETKNTDAGWGIVHLYREGEEPRHTELPTSEPMAANDAIATDSDATTGTILCIPAVPSYLTPSDFLGFVGEKWRGDVSHYRMVMTSKMNRYMVLMKFKDEWRASCWRKEFDGKAFDSLGSELCHVTFIKSITIESPSQSKVKSAESKGEGYSAAAGPVVNSLKPFPPPTPDLIELPTCPVCLERMDDTTGLMTILCQHVFHCTCLQTWKGSGCPVCRATNPAPQGGDYDPNNPYTQPFGNGVSNLCSVCDSTEDLWICLICGNVGCGRYKGAHAKQHWKETAHSFSLELETQHVWDYAGDMWAHRLIRDKGDGKVFELPRNNHEQDGRDGGNAEAEDVVPRAKLEHIGIEYTHLLTSQLESQRVYFEEMVNKAVDKASKAAAAAESASAQAGKAIRELSTLQTEHRTLVNETLPSLEKDLARERNRAVKSTELARSLGKALQEEKQVGEGLMKRIDHVNKELLEVKTTMQSLRAENEELKETNRDLTMFISGQEKLRELENEGKIEQGELEDGMVSLPEEKRKRGKGKGKR